MALPDQILARDVGMGPWQTVHGGLAWRRIDLDCDDLRSATDLLAADETERSERFAFARDRGRYVAARAALRLSLADMTGRSPRHIRFAYGAHGKPRLSEDDGWLFNLSHSRSTGVIAIGRADVVGEVGIDIEAVEDIADWSLLAEANFSPEECRELKALRDEDRARGFLSCWTRKEACVKALGTGLTLSTAGFTVGLQGERFAVSIEAGGVRRALDGQSIALANDFVGAIAWCTRPHCTNRKG